MYNEEETKKFLRERVARAASAGVIVENSAGEALVLKAHYKNYWSFPGGWIEEGQTPIEAALRELLEEAGITIEKKSLRFAFILNRVSKIMQTYQFIFKYSSTLTESQVKKIVLQQDEIANFAFVTKDDVRQNPDMYGGAVQLWATNEAVGYFEQEVKI